MISLPNLPLFAHRSTRDLAPVKRRFPQPSLEPVLPLRQAVHVGCYAQVASATEWAQALSCRTTPQISWPTHGPAFTG